MFPAAHCPRLHSPLSLFTLFVWRCVCGAFRAAAPFEFTQMCGPLTLACSTRCGKGTNRIAITVGTSAAVRIVDDGASACTAPEGLWRYRIDRSRTLIGGALTDGGSIVEWCRKLMRLEDNAEWDEVMSEVAAMPKCR